MTKYLFSLVLLFALHYAHADTLQFCSASPIAAASSTPNYTETLSSTGVIASGACGTPPPVCTKPFVVPNGVGGNYTRWATTTSVNYFGLGNITVDTTKYDSIFGQKPTPETWPGNSGITAVLPVPISKYLSAMFTVPSGYMANAPANRVGEYLVNASSFGGAGISATISTCPGDFSNPAAPGSTVVAGCWGNKVRGGGRLLFWEPPQHVSPSCVLKDGATYYLNIINADISTVAPNGGGKATSTTPGARCTTSCSDPVANYIFN